MKALGGSGTDIGYAVARDANGNVMVAGSFSGTVDFGGGPLTSASGHPSMFVAKYSSSGTPVWSRAVSGSGGSVPAAIAVDGNGDVLVTGSFAGTADFGGGALTSTGTADIFLAKYASATGAYLWAQRFGDIANSGFGITAHGNGVAVDSSNNVLLTGSFQGVVNFGGSNLSDSSLTTDVFVVKFNAAGVHQWSKNFPNTALDSGQAIAVDPSGNVAITGTYTGTVNFGGGNLPAGHGGLNAAFVAEFDPSGTHLWSRGFFDTTAGTAALSVFGNGVACDSSGNVVITGSFGHTVDFGTGILTASGSRDIFLAKYSSSGTPAWTHHYGSVTSNAGGQSSADAVAIDSGGNIAIVGVFYNTSLNTGTDFGGGALLSVGQGDGFVAKYTSAGTFSWAKRYGGSVADEGRAVAIDGGGNVLVTGNFSGTADFATHTLTSSAGSSDVFLARLLADGSL